MIKGRLVLCSGRRTDDGTADATPFAGVGLGASHVVKPNSLHPVCLKVSRAFPHTPYFTPNSPAPLSQATFFATSGGRSPSQVR